MAARVSQSAHRDSLLAANRAVITRIRGTVSSIPADALIRRPDAGWSIAEVLEHLIISADSYVNLMKPIIQAKTGPADANTMWKPTLMGGLLTASQRSPRKMPTARVYKPGPSPRPHVLEEFVRRQEEIGRLIAEAGTMDWRRVRIRSPVTSLLRMNLGDAFTVLVVHAERHAAQIERVKATMSGEATR
jgi:hypothetical protein